MSSIKLRNAIPDIFADSKSLTSEVWLHDVDFERGKSYLIEADSGTGKSSLCSYIYGLRSDYQGTILIDDRDIRRFSINKWCEIRQSKISILFQDLRLFGELTAMENCMNLKKK